MKRVRERLLLTTSEVAALLRVHPKHVYRLLKRGLPAHRVGGEWRYVRSEVLTWSGRSGERPEPSHPQNAPPLLAANGDVVVDILLRQLVTERKPLVGALLADRGTALGHLAARRVLFAGHHGEPPPPSLLVDAAPTRLARIHLVRREVGLAFVRGARIRRLRDLRGKRLASRPTTAGVHAHLQRALDADGTSLAALRVCAHVFESHAHAVCAVLRGEAGVALATAAWAARVGLQFVPFAEESYDLLVLAEHLGSPEVVAVCEVVASKAFTRATRAAGYRTQGAGQIRVEGDLEE